MLQLQALEDMRVLEFCKSGGQQPDLALANQNLCRGASMCMTGLGCIMQLWTQKIKVIQVKQPGCGCPAVDTSWITVLRQPQVYRKHITSCPGGISGHTLLKAEAHVLQKAICLRTTKCLLYMSHDRHLSSLTG